MFENIRLLPSTLLRMAREYARKLWVRVVAMGLLAFLAVGLTQLIEPLVPESLATTLPGETVDRLLQIIANAMLAATIFTMTVMVTVYRNSSSQWSPRVHQLIMHDSTTQKTLAAFIGAYVYALVAIVLREMGVFMDERALTLFAMTVLVLALVVLSLVRWVLHLQTFGSLLATTRQLEDIARRQFEERLDTPCLGANPLTGPVPDAAWPLSAGGCGYIRSIYPEGLQAIAERYEVRIYLSVPIGHFVFTGQPLVWVMGQVPDPDEEDGDDCFADLVRDHVELGALRSYDQDPRFGLVVLGEIASKALSPGINDPGTAIDVITRIGRILYSYRDETQREDTPPHDRLWVPPLSPHDLLDDGLGSLARDGAHLYEVQKRLQDTLEGLMGHSDAALADVARNMAVLAMRRALEQMDFAPDRERLLASAPPEVRRGIERATDPAT